MKKKIYSTLLIIVLIAFQFTEVKAQRNTIYVKNLSKKDEIELINKAIKLIKEYGPGYYKPNNGYTIEEFTYSLDGMYDKVSRNNGRKYYNIIFDCDLNKEMLKELYSAKVNIWKDTKKPWSVTFGNGKEILFLVPRRVSRSSHYIIPYEQDTLYLKKTGRLKNGKSGGVKDIVKIKNK